MSTLVSACLSYVCIAIVIQKCMKLYTLEMAIDTFSFQSGRLVWWYLPVQARILLLIERSVRIQLGHRATR